MICGSPSVGIYYFPLKSQVMERDDNLKYRLPRQVTVIDKKSSLNITTFTPLQQEVDVLYM